jgi:hypothetical protein
MTKPLDPKLYERVKQEAKQTFKRWPSAYGSAWLVREYKRRGGKYASSSDTPTGRAHSHVSHRTGSASKPPQGVGRWMQEEWIQVAPYLRSGKKVACGARKNAHKACRPLKRISSETPATILELVKLHGKKRILELATMKVTDMDGILYWKRGVFNPSR